MAAKFDSRFELLHYDACYDERFEAKNCSGTWQERGNNRWLETLEGRVVAEYNVNSLLYKYKNGDWKRISSIGILWDSEADFRNFIERQVACGIKEVI